MKIKRIGMKLLKLSLCVMLLAGMCNDFIFTTIQSNESYFQDFEDADISNWKKEIGAGTFEQKDGKLNIQTDGWVPGVVDYQLYYDNDAPIVDNGVISADIDSKNGNGRFALVFRYQDSRNYDYVGYDVSGNWKLMHRVNGRDTEKAIASQPNIDNQSFHLQIKFISSNIEVKVNDTVIYTGADLASDSTGGKIAIKTWGYTANYAHINVDNLRLEKRNAPEDDGNGNYKVSFTDETKRGGWQKLSGDGTISFTDGIDDAGFMSVKANGNTFYSDTLSPIIKNGFIEADVTNRSAGRIGFLFRMKNANDFAGLGYDGDGTWNWIDGKDRYGSFVSGAALPKGTKKHIRIEYVGDNIRLLIDGQEVAKRNIPELNISEGNIGIRTWGYDTGDTQGGMDIDNVVVGKFNAVLLDPSNKTVRYNEAGTFDIPIRLSQLENTFQRLEIDGQEINIDSDYTVNQNKSMITLKKEWVAKKKTEGGTSTAIKFVFEDGYIAPFHLQVLGKPNTEKVTYLRDFAKGFAGFNKVLGNATITENTKKHTLDITNANNLVMIDENSPDLHNSEVEYTFDPKNDHGNFGIVVRYENENSWTMIGQEGSGANNTNWVAITSDGKKIDLCQDGNRIYAKRVKPYKVKVRVVEDVVTIFLDNAEIYTGKVDGITNGTGKTGIRNWGNSGTSISYIAVNSSEFIENETAKITSETISSKEMDVNVDAAFPSILDYTLDGKTIQGQKKPVHVVEVNNTYYTPNVSADFTDDKAVYHLSFDDIDVTFDVEFKVEENVVNMKINNIDDSEHAIYTINFPNHSLVSIANNQPQANLRVNNYRKETNIDLIDRTESDTYAETTLAVLSNSELAASISNGSIKRRQEVAYQTFVNADHYTTGIWTNEFLYRGLDGEIIEKPWTKIAITNDRNQDGKVDYQDGAIARRDDIGLDYVGSETVMESFNSIAMNVGSAAQYPFLRILDNIKKFNLGTDGFKQNIVIKGYQSEGHDAAHPDFANYNTRAGGLEDFQKLLNEAERYNAMIGVHINHTEAYPEAKQYNDVVSTVGGWSWYDDAKQIIRENDILNTKDGMAKRLQDLDDDTLKKLSMIYVDVYFDTRWPMSQLVNKINSMHGTAVGTEYVDEMTQNSVWGHHIDGRFNNAGDLVRMVSNSTQDIFAGNALFRDAGTRNVGFNGWQNSTNYNDSISLFFTKVLPNKYLAQYPIMQYETANKVTLGKDNEVVSTMEGNVNKISKDGHLIADGNNVFIPWAKDDADKTKEGKIYHWNNNGGETKWVLPTTWANESKVVVYELNDQGKHTPVEVVVADQQVSISAKAKTGYVIYKGSDSGAVHTGDMKWSDGSVVKDMGFDSHSFDYAWKKTQGDESVNFYNNHLGNTHLMMNGADEGEVVQSMSGLEIGESYSASVWVKVDNGKVGSIEIQNGEELLSNYIDQSNVIYGVHHTDKYKAYAQRVSVRFVAKAEEATIRLKAGASEANGSVDFDDVRVRKVKMSDQKEHFLVEDFENVDEGYGVFVTTESDNSHLSQTHKPYTNDTISGEHSLKIRSGDLMRTMPHTVRFKANTRYKVSLDYLASQSNLFTVSIKTDNGSKTIATQTCGGANNEKKNVMLNFVTEDESDYYIEIAPTTAKRGSYVVDNLMIDEIVVIDKEALQTLQDKALLMIAQEDVYLPDSIAALQKITAAVETVLAKDNPSESELETHYELLDNAIMSAEKYATTEQKEALAKVIDDLEKLNPDDFKQDDKWDFMQDKMVEAKALLKKDNVSETQISQMKQVLLDAKADLNTMVDKTALEEMYGIADAIDLKNFVDGSENSNFNSVKASAEKMIAQDDARQDDVDKMHEQLVNAYNALIPMKAYKDELVKTAVKAATEALKHEHYYDEETLAKISASLSELETLLSNSKANLGSVLDELSALQEAIDNRLSITVNVEASEGGVVEGGGSVKAGDTITITATPNAKYHFDGYYANDTLISSDRVYTFVAEESMNLTAKFVKVSTVELEALLQSITQLDEDNYTKDSWKALQKVVKEATDLLASDYTATQISEMYEKLEIAKANLQFDNEVSKDDLSKFIADNKLTEIDGSLYISKTYEAFAIALQDALDLLKEEDASSKDYENAIKQLQKTRANLILKATAEQMNELIYLMDSYQKDSYTEQSWKVFADVLAEIKADIAENEMSLEDVNAAMIKIKEAAKQLVVNKEEGNQVETSDSTNPMKNISLVIIGAGLMFVVYKKRKMIKKS